MENITSKDNRLIKTIKSLYTKEGREREGLFVIEGVRNVRDAIAKKADIAYIVIAASFKGDLDFSHIKLYKVTDKLFSYISDTVTPQGVMAVCRIKDISFKDIDLKDDSFIVVCENLQDPGNAGTVIRTADAAGAAAVIMMKGSVDIYNPKTARSLMSSLFSVKVVRNKTQDAVFGYLNDMKIKSVAGALRDDAECIFDADLTGRCALFIGNEGSGLTPETIKRCSTAVKIPMLGGAESLNASAAAAVMMYEHVRQNRGNKKF